MAMYEEYAARVEGTTIDRGTLLSTDYFNTFNEIIMLLGMLPDAPEMLEDVKSWQFRSYEDHFRDSGLPFAPLAIEAYAHVPAATRAIFDHNVLHLRRTVEQALDTLTRMSAQDEIEEMKRSAVDYSLQLQALVEFGGTIVHGQGSSADQSAVDDMF
jgi:hypothetical protein